MKKLAYLSKSKMLRDFQKLKKVYSLWVVGNSIIFKIFNLDILDCQSLYPDSNIY